MVNDFFLSPLALRRRPPPSGATAAKSHKNSVNHVYGFTAVSFFLTQKNTIPENFVPR